MSVRFAIHCFAAVVAICAMIVAESKAGTIVLANRTAQSITCQILQEKDKDLPITIAAGGIFSLRTRGSRAIRFPASVRANYTIDPNAIYYFGAVSESRIDLARIALGGDATASTIFETDWFDSDTQFSAPIELVTIPVKILVDEDEAAKPEIWQQRLRHRIAEASRIFERHCFVRLEVVAVGTWRSNNEVTAFEQSFAEFERTVDPRPARLAIGFTSQYRIKPGHAHLGGTRGPLNSHVLVREWSNRISESERLEVLVHELGHFLGAVHSPEHNSVMRPVLGDKQARNVGFRIGFDPINTFAMCLISESLRGRPVGRITDLDLPSQLELLKLYGEMARIDPREPSAAQYVEVLNQQSVGRLVDATRLVVASINTAAKQNAALPEPAPTALVQSQETGDALTDSLVRYAAILAKQLRTDVGPRAFLLGLGLGLDRTNSLTQHRLIGPLTERIESDAQRQSRLDLLGVPTIHGKHEWARHFALAMALTAIVGPQQAETECLALQLGTHDKPGSFTPAAYQANLAGIVFAHRVLTDKLLLSRLGVHFDAAEYVPLGEGLPDPVSPGDFHARYGSPSDERFRVLRKQIGQRIHLLASQMP